MVGLYLVYAFWEQSYATHNDEGRSLVVHHLPAILVGEQPPCQLQLKCFFQRIGRLHIDGSKEARERRIFVAQLEGRAPADFIHHPVYNV